ncbi:MAG TPA: hypothetical protein VKS82_19065 [Streptosporangiaceae bacterium]|nr:hypothetical protein [Streptosporangiaceae bacterium]
MASERGTIPRNVDGAWPEPTAPSGRRLPSAPRERKPALAALAVVLIVGGALAAGLLVIQQGHKTGAIEVTQTVGQGQQIPPGALQEIQVSTGLGIDYVPWDEASQVTRTYAATTIPAGTLLTPQMTVATNNLATGLTQIGVALKDGQMPDGLQVGDRVDVYVVSDSAGQCPRPANFLLTTNAVVLSIQRPLDNSSSAAFDVQLGVSPGDAGGVTCNAANNNVSIGIIPSGQAGASPSSQPAAAPGNPAAKHPGGPATTPTGSHATSSQTTGGSG